MTIKELLEKEGLSEEDALKEQALLGAYAKISHFQAECSYYEKKYNMSFNEIKNRIESTKNEEDFQMEDDFMEWEYCESSRNWWQEKVREVVDADKAA